MLTITICTGSDFIKELLISDLDDIFNKLPGENFESYYQAKHVLYFLYFAGVIPTKEFNKYDYFLNDVYNYFKFKGDIS